MATLGATEFKATCLEVLERVRRTGKPVTITKRGKPVARLVPATEEGKDYPQNRLRGTGEILGDLIEPAVPREQWHALAEPIPRARYRGRAHTRKAKR
jgi:prevent-host-death family protein